MTDVVSAERLEKYFSVTRRALGKVQLTIPASCDFTVIGADFLDMAQRYLSDAEFFSQKGDIVTAFAALNYAHGWLDAGARLGVFDVGGDSELFVVD